MGNLLLDFGAKQKPANLPNEDFKAGFMDSVKNSQTRLALNYLVGILNELNDRIEYLEDRLSETDVDLKTEEAAPKKPRVTKTAAADEQEN